MRLKEGAAVLMAMGFLATSSFGQMSRGDRYSGAQWATRSPVPRRNTAWRRPNSRWRPRSRIDILKKGGSAVDAAIAANARHRADAAGAQRDRRRLFAIVYDPKTHKLYGYNGSGRSAEGRDLEKSKAEIEAAYERAGAVQAAYSAGRLAADHRAGTVDAWFALHGKFGKLPIKDDLAPAIPYARTAFR